MMSPPAAFPWTGCRGVLRWFRPIAVGCCMLPASVVRLAHISCFDLEACWLIRGLCESGQPAADNDVSFPQSLDSRTAGERASHPERATKKMFQRFEWCAPCPVVGVASDCGFVENVASVVLLPLHDSTQPVSQAHTSKHKYKIGVYSANRDHLQDLSQISTGRRRFRSLQERSSRNG